METELKECARCKKPAPVADYENCFITCSKCRRPIKEYPTKHTRMVDEQVGEQLITEYDKDIVDEFTFDRLWDDIVRIHEGSYD